MKKDIEWHKQCLRNRLRTISEKRDQLLRMETELERVTEGSGLYAKQIDLAIKEGKDGFDRDKYAVKRFDSNTGG
ncbi:MAG: hypothetical protein HOL70_10085 [Candidatus Marinimicrobia bacterium]|jgi:hypothetical protein|nr:hypothetical protein [Candidatus Neomarinimicrobiota bacterium]